MPKNELPDEIKGSISPRVLEAMFPDLGERNAFVEKYKKIRAERRQGLSFAPDAVDWAFYDAVMAADGPYFTKVAKQIAEETGYNDRVHSSFGMLAHIATCAWLVAKGLRK